MKKKLSKEAKAYHDLKMAYRSLSRSPRTNASINKAIDYFNSTLEFFSKDKNPDGWAIIQEGLGFSYFSLRPKNKLQNIYLAIDHLMNIFSVPVKYRQKEIMHVYVYLAELGHMLLRFYDKEEANTKEYKRRMKQINDLLDKVLRASGDTRRDPN